MSHNFGCMCESTTVLLNVDSQELLKNGPRGRPTKKLNNFQIFVKVIKMSQSLVKSVRRFSLNH